MHYCFIMQNPKGQKKKNKGSAEVKFIRLQKSWIFKLKNNIKLK